MSHRNEVVREDAVGAARSSALWSAGASLYTMGTGALVTAFAARHFGAVEFGRLALALAVIGLLTTLATMGMDPAVVRRLVRDQEPAVVLHAAVATRFLASGGVLAVAICGSLLIAPNSTLQILVWLLGGSLFLRSPEALLSWFRARVDLKTPSAIRMFTYTATALFRLLLLSLGCTLTIFTVSYVTDAVLFSTALLFVLMRRPGVRPNRLVPSWRVARSIWRDALPLMVSGVAIALYSRVDQIMLGIFRPGSPEVGIYAACVTVAELWYFVPMALVNSLQADVMRESFTSGTTQTKRMFSAVGFASIGLAAGVAIVAPLALAILYGSQFTSGANALRILCAASFLAMIGTAETIWLLGRGQQKLTLVLTLLGAAVNVALNAVLIPSHGAVGAASATLVAEGCVVALFPLLSKTGRPVLRVAVDGLSSPRSALEMLGKSLV